MSTSKAKGTAAETAVVRFLQANGYPHAERRALAGNQDRGDVAGVKVAVIEVKNCQRMELAAWLDEAHKESLGSGASVALVWHKRRGKGSPGDWYVTMDGWDALAMLEQLDWFKTQEDDDA